MEEKKKSKVLKVIVIVLAILGLLTVIAIVCGFIYKKFKKMIKILNQDLVLESSEEAADDPGCIVTEEEPEDE